MANLRRSSRPGPGARPGLSQAAPSAPVPGTRLRWLLIAAAAVAALLVLAWIDGGEEPLHPISQAVDLGQVRP